MRVYGSATELPTVDDLSYEIGWCLKHRDLAKRYDDGSWGCWWEDMVEANGYHDDSDYVELTEANERGELHDE